MFGELQNCIHGPLILLHGGPGMVHNHLRSYSDLTAIYSIPIVLYDQIGNGKSTHLPEKAGNSKFWTQQLFIDELNNLLAHLGIEDNYDLLGHSWGGILSAHYAIQRPKGFHHLILYSCSSSMTLWDEIHD